MKRKVYLKGELANLYGSELTMDVKRASEVFSCLEANFGNVKQYLIDSHEKGVGFQIFVADENIEKEEDLLLPMKEGDVIITPVPAGSSSGGGKILAAVAIVGLMVAFPYVIGLNPGGIGAAFSISSSTMVGQLALGLAVNLALTGIQQLMAPDPAVDENEESYLFNGRAQNIVEGDPVPVLYGQLRVPGRPISFEVVNDNITVDGTLETIPGTNIPVPSGISPNVLNPNIYIN